MKVRIEFQEPGESEDVECHYDSVELTTFYAGDIERWGDAIADIAGLAMWQRRAILLAALKLSRETHQRKRDNWVDIAGYARCGSLCR